MKYKKVNRVSGHPNPDINPDIKVGLCKIPVRNYDKEDRSKNYDYVKCIVLKVDNTGRSQMVIVGTSDKVLMMYYNGSEQLYKPLGVAVTRGVFVRANSDMENPGRFYDLYQFLIAE